MLQFVYCQPASVLIHLDYMIQMKRFSTLAIISLVVKTKHDKLFYIWADIVFFRINESRNELNKINVKISHRRLFKSYGRSTYELYYWWVHFFTWETKNVCVCVKN